MKFSVVTPSYNQGCFIQKTIRSVLGQAGEFSIEFMVVDGGSSDDTIKILKKYENLIDTKQTSLVCRQIQFSWVSESDDGQADAVNKGIKNTHGDIIAWINSDDIYYPGAFDAVSSYFRERQDADVVYGRAFHIGRRGRIIEPYPVESWNYERLKEVCFLCQPAVFFRRRIIDDYGLLDASLHYSMDYELWLRVGRATPFHFIDFVLAGSRMYKENKTISKKVEAHYEINEMLSGAVGLPHRNWIYAFAHHETSSVMHTFERSTQIVEHFWETVCEAFIKWWGWIPPEEIAFLNYSYKCTIPVKYKRKLPGLDSFRIGFDISISGQDDVGHSKLVDNMIDALVKIRPQDKFILYSVFGEKKSHEDNAQRRFVNRPNVFYALDTLDSDARDRFWKHLPAGSRATLGMPDVIHVNGSFCPRISGTRIIFSLYETPLNTLVNSSSEDEFFHEHCFQVAAQNADVIIAPSSFILKKFFEYFPDFPEDRAKVVPIGPGLPQAISARTVDCLQNKNFYLFFCADGDVNRLKIWLEAYQDCGPIEAKLPELVFYCPKGALGRQIKKVVLDSGLMNHVTIMEDPDDHHLKWLHKNCLALFYFPEQDTLGIPILDAFSLGVPVITSDTPYFRELCGNAALFMDSQNGREIRNVISDLNTQPSLLENLRFSSTAISAQLSWEETARSIRQVYEHAMSLVPRTRAIFCMDRPLEETKRSPATKDSRSLFHDLSSVFPDIKIFDIQEPDRVQLNDLFQRLGPDLIISSVPIELDFFHRAKVLCILSIDQATFESCQNLPSCFHYFELILVFARKPLLVRQTTDRFGSDKLCVIDKEHSQYSNELPMLGLNAISEKTSFPEPLLRQMMTEFNDLIHQNSLLFNPYVSKESLEKQTPLPRKWKKEFSKISGSIYKLFYRIMECGYVFIEFRPRFKKSLLQLKAVRVAVQYYKKLVNRPQWRNPYPCLDSHMKAEWIGGVSDLGLNDDRSWIRHGAKGQLRIRNPSPCSRDVRLKMTILSEEPHPLNVNIESSCWRESLVVVGGSLSVERRLSLQTGTCLVTLEASSEESDVSKDVQYRRFRVLDIVLEPVN